MKATWKAGLVIGAAVLATLAIGVVQTKADKDTPDLTGTWTEDRGSWEGRGGGGDSPGGWGGGNGFRMRGGGRLPRILHISRRPNAVLFADSAGAAFQEIQIGGSPATRNETEGQNDQVRHLPGHWVSGMLEVERVGPNGGVMLQKYQLEDHGKILEVRIQRKDSDGGSSDAPRRGQREFKMVYRRTA